MDRTGSMDMMTRLADLTGMTYTFGKSVDFQHGENGNGLLTRFPILEERYVRYHTSAPDGGSSLMEIVLDVKGVDVVLLNTQLDNSKSDSFRYQQTAELIAVARKHHNVPMILCGSFEGESTSRSVSSLSEWFQDCWTAAGAGNGFTFPAAAPDRRIDYVYVSKNETPAGAKGIQTTMMPIAASLIPTDASTHLPVLVELKLVSE
jgi:endonuclease/exonuclease/phosphatase family metal-dependent hydrolase